MLPLIMSCCDVTVCYMTVLTLRYAAKCNVIYPVASERGKINICCLSAWIAKSLISSYSVCKQVERLSAHGSLVQCVCADNTNQCVVKATSKLFLSALEDCTVSWRCKLTNIGYSYKENYHSPAKFRPYS